MKKLILALTLCALFALPLPIGAAAGTAPDAFTATVTDISDRAYEPAVIALLDNARESIVMSMYLISLSVEGRNPLSLLLEDLIEARGRGVSVTIYLNTRFQKGADVRSSLEANPALKRLIDAGCVIHLLSPQRRLHDKLIIVDNRFVVDGSTNWSISALRDNYESATLIDSPGLAKAKLVRLAAFPLEGEAPAKTGRRAEAVYTQGLPAAIEIPEKLLTDSRYFPHMVTYQEERVMDAYLLVLAHAQKESKKDFFVDLESFGVSLGLSAGLDETSLRRQAIRSLRNLEKRYGLVTCRFFHSKDAYVTLTDMAGQSFPVPSDIVEPEPLAVSL